MNRSLRSHGSRPASISSIGLAFLGLAAGLACLSLPMNLRAQSDDFNDGDDTGWTRFNPFAPFGAPAQFSFPGGAYRIQAALSPAPSQLGPARAGSLRSDVVYTNFYIAVDVIDWDDTVRQAFGILARVNNFGLGTTTGYAFTYERGAGVTMTSGDTDLSSIVCEPGVSCEIPVGIQTGPSSIHLDSAKDYRFVFVGRGPILEGRIYELPDTLNPILTIIGSDNTYESGYAGLVIYDNSGDDIGIRPDVTFDNYFATDVEPPRIQVESLFADLYLLSWPAEASRFVLQESAVLPGIASNWTDVPDVLLMGDRYNYGVETDPSAGAPARRFFRLVRR